MRPRSDSLFVWTGAPCVYGCPTCPIDPQVAPGALRLADLQQQLGDLNFKTGRLVVLLGGEPFLRPDFTRLMAAIRVAGCLPGIITTARPLVYPKRREMLRRAGLAYLRIQLFGYGEIHDRAVAVPGAFEQVLGGLRDWLGEAAEDCDVDIALSARGRSIEATLGFAEALATEITHPKVQLIIALDPTVDLGQQDPKELQTALERSARWNDDAERPLLAWEGLGESVVPASSMTLTPLRPSFVGTVPVATCLGAVDDIRSVSARWPQKTCANSFNFVRTSTTVAWTESAAACTAHQAARDIEPHRQAWLIEDGQLVLHTTDSGDFEAAEISKVKNELSHLFVDRAAPGVLDDFKEGMRRALPDPTCETCHNRDHCGRRFRMIEGQPFATEEAWIASHIAALRGRVFDVGCGEQLYKEQLIPLVRSQVVQYTGIDPDEHSLGKLRAALPQARFLVGGIEGFDGEPASYDHVLCLRSLNHVINVDEAMARMASLLKPGGRLLIVECTVFAMLRRAEQVAAADRAPRAGHQHLRNLASEQVIPFARRRGLRVLHHRAATRDTTNEWILLLERPLLEPVRDRDRSTVPTADNSGSTHRE